VIHLGRLIPKRVEALAADDRSALVEAVLPAPTPADTPVVIDLAFARTHLVRCDPQRPLYRQLADMIRKIEAAHHGARLPTERRLAQELRMARVTVRKALANLEHEGIIQRRQGAGTYFASK
jgi:biotin operon repressor